MANMSRKLHIRMRAAAEAEARSSENHRKVAQDVSFTAHDPASLAGEKGRQRLAKR